MSKLTYDLKEYCEDIVNNVHKSGFTGINVVEKILKDPGFSTKGSRHRVLWWPRGAKDKSRRMAKISKAMHQIDPIPHVCLLVAHGRILKEDGNIFDERDLVKNSSLSLRDFQVHIRDAEKKIRKILRGYEFPALAI